MNHSELDKVAKNKYIKHKLEKMQDQNTLERAIVTLSGAGTKASLLLIE